MESTEIEKKDNRIKILFICFIVILVLIVIISYIINSSEKGTKNSNNTNIVDNDNDVDEDGNPKTNGKGYKEISFLLPSDIEGDITDEEKSTILNLYKETLVGLYCTPTIDGKCFPTKTEIVAFSFLYADAEMEYEKFDITKSYKNSNGIEIILSDYELYDAKKISEFAYNRFGIKIDFDSYILEDDYMNYIPSLNIITGESGGGRGPIYIESAKVEIKEDIYKLSIKWYDDEDRSYNSEMYLKKITENSIERFIYINFSR